MASLVAPLVAAGNVAKMAAIFDTIKGVSDVVNQRTLLCGMVPFPDWSIVNGLSAFFAMSAYQSVKLVNTMLQSLTPGFAC